jgi:hypothetical protein
MRIERTTSPLPRECSTTELQEPTVSFLWEIAAILRFLVYKKLAHIETAHLALSLPKRARTNAVILQPPYCFTTTKSGAGERDRTVVCSLEGCRSTIELLPQLAHDVRHGTYHHISHHPKNWWRELDSNQRTRKRADLQSAAINHSAISPREPSIIKTFMGNVNLQPVSAD